MNTIADSLDLATLQTVRAEVAQREAAVRGTWMMQTGDAIMTACELASIGRWLDVRIAAEDAELERWAITCEGRKALASAEVA